jgi:feruloyl esterase
LLQSAALAACGEDGAYIRDPAACRFDPAAVACKPGSDPAKCLTPAQLATAKVIYGGVRDPRNGRLLNAGFSPGAEAQPGSWPLWVTGPSEDKRAGALNYLFSSNAFRYFAFGDPSFDLLKLDLGAEFERGWANTRVLDSTSPDLKAFRDHGGKLINYHGWNDPAIPAKASIAYYEQAARATGKADTFYRLYLVPGMLHCGGGPGPSNIDWLAVLADWVKSGKRPEAVVATGANGASQTLCPYPSVADKAGKCIARR